MLRRHASIILSAILFSCTVLFSACAEGDNPFPYQPNLPTDFNRDDLSELTGSMVGNVSMFTYERVSEEQGLQLQRVGCFDTSGRCIDYYHRDSHITLRYHYTYDAEGRRIEELCYLDSCGTSYDSLTYLYTQTTYHYSRNGRICKARITGPNGRRYTFRMRYNGQGQLLRYIFPDGSRISYAYDADGRLEKQVYPDASSHTVAEPVRKPVTYDGQGHVVEEAVSGQEGLVLSYYVYDDHDNWVRRTTTGERVPSTIELRTFQYYE